MPGPFPLRTDTFQGGAKLSEGGYLAYLFNYLWSKITGFDVIDSTTATNQTTALTSDGTAATVDSTTATNGTTALTSDGTAASVDSTTATNGTTAAVIDSSALPTHETFVNPQAEATVLKAVVETDGVVSASLAIDAPTTLQVAFDAGWSGGNVKVTGKAPNGAAVDETFTSTPGSTVVGVKGFASIDASGIENLTPAGSGTDEASVQVGPALAMCASGDTTASKLTVDGVSEAISAQSATNHTVTPTTAKAATKTFDVWHTSGHVHTSAAHDHTQAGHTHNSPSHTHTVAAHGHTQSGHTHSSPSHTHTVAAHGHTQNAHTHTAS